MIFFPGPSLIIHLLILIIGKIGDRVRFSLKDQLISIGFLAYLFVFFITTIVFLSAYILINESFKHETTFALIRRTLSDNVALVAVEKLSSREDKQHKADLETKMFNTNPVSIVEDAGNLFKMGTLNFNFPDNFSKSFLYDNLSKAGQLLGEIKGEKGFAYQSFVVQSSGGLVTFFRQKE